MRRWLQVSCGRVTMRVIACGELRIALIIVRAAVVQSGLIAALLAALSLPPLDAAENEVFPVL